MEPLSTTETHANDDDDDDGSKGTTSTTESSSNHHHHNGNDDKDEAVEQVDIRDEPLWKPEHRLVVMVLAILVILVQVTLKTTKTTQRYYASSSKLRSAEGELARYTDFCPHEARHINQSLPLPVILISRGRSGSSAIWQVITNMTGFETASDEHTGQNPEQNRAFFTKHTDETWLLRVLCQKRQQYPEASVVGIKWKLFPDTLNYVGARKTLRYLAAAATSHNDQAHNQSTTAGANSLYPPIKVIRSRRNVLDYWISTQKHQDLAPKNPDGTRKDTLLAHCPVHDTECAAALHRASVGIHLPTKDLPKRLRIIRKEDDEVEDYLRKFKVPFLKVTYDALYADVFDNNNNNNGTTGKETALAEWKRVFAFLNREKPVVDTLTLQQVRSAAATQVTFSTWHNTTLSNYQQVRKKLHGHKDLEGLLHKRHRGRRHLRLP